MAKKYWKGLEELNENPEFKARHDNEFAENLPSDFLGKESLNETSTSRRDFLKFVGFSVGAAALASCETPVTKTIPYIIKPEDVTPGTATWYASTYADGNDYASILVKTREGRPIKIEGNKMSKVTAGGVNARIQASVLSLYDNTRLKGPKAKGTDITWENADSEIGAKLEEISKAGGAIRILSSTIISPSTNAVIAEFIAKYPTTKHITHDAVSYSAIRKANQNTFGQWMIPTYMFDRANVVVSFGADFLINWLSPVEFSKQYVKNRKVSKEKKSMSKHIQFETTLSVTGSNADVRVAVKPSEMGANIVALYNAVAGGALPVKGKASDLPAATQAFAQRQAGKIGKVAEWLKANKGKSLVVCGVNDPAMQTVVNEINKALDNYGNLPTGQAGTIDVFTPSMQHAGNDEEFAALVNDMKEGKISALITYNTNPCYTASAIGFEEAYNKVGLKVSFAQIKDETSMHADYILPDHHYLEAWNDACPRKGEFSLGQPTIAPLFNTRAAQETLLKLTGNNSDYHTYIQQTWAKLFAMDVASLDFINFWNKSLHDGTPSVSPEGGGKETTSNSLPNGGTQQEKKVQDSSTPLGMTQEKKMVIADYALMISKQKGGAWELVLYQKAGIGTGNQANNPWLHELPDPISKVCWDNYLTMNPVDMKNAGLNLLERQDNDGDIVTLTVGSKTVSVPVYPQPGQALGTVGLALGYGRSAIGKVAEQAGGVDAYSFVTWIGNCPIFSATDVKVGAKTGEVHKFAATQTHHTMMGRSIVKETDLSTYSSQPKHIWNILPEVAIMEGHELKEKPVSAANLWADHEKPGHRWGLNIDLNSCIGCGSCVVSCNAENNIAVVGKDEVMRSREMHWMRIDRYYSSDMNDEKGKEEGKNFITVSREMESAGAFPSVTFQPVMCQHCNHAPCETVCPVLATNHTMDGLNAMAYNRCIGTRYCANNCPYKVRRFNWFEYGSYGKFAGLNPAQEADTLGRMVLNPDVVVRSRGVMEKCSMCIQRIQAGKLKAKTESRKLVDGDIETACQQSCPTNAIMFGDLNDSTSEVSKLFADERSYFLLEEVGIKPSVAYMTKVRNIDPETIVKKESHQEETNEAKKES